MKETPKPCAGNQGTSITIENLFYNLPSRLRSITKDKSTEDKHLSDVVTKYAIHNSNIGFSLRINESKNTIKTQSKGTHVDAIRTLYGAEIANNLLELSINDANLRFKCSGFISKPNNSIKKMIMLLFINNRLVKSGAFKKMIDELYENYFEKGGKPFVYVSLELDSQNVDVNIHPTKKEVCFLHEETIYSKIKTELDALLKGKSETKVYLSQTILPGASKPVTKTEKSLNMSVKSQNDDAEKSFYPKQTVRTDTNLQTLDKFLNSTILTPKSQELEEETFELRKNVELHSVKLLREEILSSNLPEWRKIFEELVFVGHIDRGKALIQHNTDLYLCETEPLW